MKVWGLTEEQVKIAADTSGVRVNELKKEGRALRFTLRLKEGKKWQRVSHTGRKVAAVCFHGHLSFMREVFRLCPEARIKTCCADYHSAQELDETAHKAGERNTGSMFYHLEYQEACLCD